MSQRPPRAVGSRERSRPRSTAPSIFEAIADAEASHYLRNRDLPGLIALWPKELADQSREGTLVVLAKLRRALRAERRRARRTLEL